MEEAETESEAEAEAPTDTERVTEREAGFDCGSDDTDGNGAVEAKGLEEATTGGLCAAIAARAAKAAKLAKS